jgi:hypothetical protein
MVIRPSKDVLESLRVTLQKLEHGLDPTHDASAMAELKRMVLLRIAELADRQRVAKCRAND